MRFALQETSCQASFSATVLPSSLLTENILGQYEFVMKGDPPVVGITKLKESH